MLRRVGSFFGEMIPTLLVVGLSFVSSAWGAIGIEATISADQGSPKGTVSTTAFSTIFANELLLAFVNTDYKSGTNTQVNSIRGAGLTWVLVVRTNTQRGTSEIWRAFATTALANVKVTATLSQRVACSLTVMSFTGVDSSGTNGSGSIGATKSASAGSGAPTATLVTTRNSSWVFGVGNDPDNPIARTPGTGQSLVHQYLTTKNTYWVQKQNSPTSLSGTSVTINDTAPTTDRYNLTIVEVLPAPVSATTYVVSGNITPGLLGSGSSIALSQNGTTIATAGADINGNYSFSSVANGTYTLTPTKSGINFSPTSQIVTVNGGPATVPAFTATAQTWTVSGIISPASIATGSNVSLSQSGTSIANATVDPSGNYSFPSVVNGTYTVTPSQPGISFSPIFQNVTVNGGNQTLPAFTASQTWTVSGMITPGTAGITVNFTGSTSGTTSTGASGNYTLNGLQNGTYTVTPAASGCTFAPSSQNVTVNGANVANVNFTAQTVTSAALAIDVNVLKDNGSAASSITSPAFSTTSSNELLLAMVATDSTSSNMTVTGVTGGGLTWSLVRRTNAQGGTSEIWRANAASTLTNVSVTANLSQTVVGSMTVLSFSGADPTGPVGATGTGNAASGAPTASLITTRNNSWVLGVGNDYANAVARTVPSNQTLIHQDLSPTGDTYWMQRQNAPTPTSGTSVTINDTAPTSDSYNLTIVEVLPASSGSGGGDTVLPTVAVIAPAPNGNAVAMTTLAANASDNVAVAGVQFIIDGIDIGNELSSPPYYMTWDSTSVSNGTHTLSARARDTSNLTSTSSIAVNVDNSGSPAVVGSWSSVVTLPAVAVNLVLLKNNKLLFYQDGATPEVWDYINNTFTNVPAPADLFCSGHASLADGRILVVGGFGGGSGPLGISNAEIFDPATNQWIAVPSMSYDRWYPTATTLSDGRILVTSGAQKQSGDIAGIPEVYDSSTNQWTKLTNANNPFETYPFIYHLPDGRVIHVGGSEFPTDTDILNLNTQTWSVVDSRIIDGGSSAMYLPNKIIKAGSATDSQGTGPSFNTTFLLDMTAASPSWQRIPSMAYVRSFLNLTVLPDGTVLATGGETDKNGGNIANAVYTAELWSPATQTWTTMSAMKTPREYHGTALLLPDGRVVESGMGADFGSVPEQKSAEFYSPPYLFKGIRPTISQPPAQINYNTSFSVGTPDAASIAKVVLIRLGAVTHFFDENTGYVPLNFIQATGGLTVTAPVDGSLAPPGYYMLFLVNSNGVPSVAPILQVGP